MLLRSFWFFIYNKSNISHGFKQVHSLSLYCFLKRKLLKPIFVTNYVGIEYPYNFYPLAIACNVLIVFIIKIKQKVRFTQFTCSSTGAIGCVIMYPDTHGELGIAYPPTCGVPNLVYGTLIGAPTFKLTPFCCNVGSYVTGTPWKLFKHNYKLGHQFNVQF